MGKAAEKTMFKAEFSMSSSLTDNLIHFGISKKVASSRAVQINPNNLLI